jgi:hypothetical protein
MNADRTRVQGLDALLQDWSTRHALPLARAEAIRHALPDPPARLETELTVAWWHRLFRPVTTTLPRPTDMARYLRHSRVTALQNPV